MSAARPLIRLVGSSCGAARRSDGTHRLRSRRGDQIKPAAAVIGGLDKAVITVDVSAAIAHQHLDILSSRSGPRRARRRVEFAVSPAGGALLTSLTIAFGLGGSGAALVVTPSS